MKVQISEGCALPESIQKLLWGWEIDGARDWGKGYGGSIKQCQEQGRDRGSLRDSPWLTASWWDESCSAPVL